MKIVLLAPAGAMHRFRGSFKKPLHYAPLTLTTLAALVPPELNAEVKIIDETAEPLNLDFEADIVGITAITGTSMRAYKIADYIRKVKKIPVVLGGVHPSLLPYEAIKHADAVVVGFAENSWPRLLRDFKEGKMKKFYYMEPDFTLKNRPIPRRELLKKERYSTINTVEAIRGCIHDCNFCAATAAWGRRIYPRPVREVIEEIEKLKGKEVAFVDINLIANPSYAKKLFREMIPLKKWWFGLVTSNVTKDKELFKLIVKSGCKGLLIGFESVIPSSQGFIKKHFNRVAEYKILMNKLHDAGIAVNGTFVFGTDEDDKSVFEKTVDMVIKLKIDLPRYAILTPFPGTPLYMELEKQGRIIERNWALYDVQHCVFKPLKMSPEELEEGLRWAWKETYSYLSIFKRISSSRTLFLLSAILNLAYKIYAHKHINFTKEVMTDNSDIPE